MTTHLIHRFVDTRTAVVLLIMLLVMLVLGACRRADGGNLSGEPVARGEATFHRHCASCHGSRALGDGPVAPFLTVHPANLTTLARDNGGSFPTIRIVQTIDGRDSVRAHGTRAMPVWGNIWSEAEGRPLSYANVETRIGEVAEYIRTLQVSTVRN